MAVGRADPAVRHPPDEVLGGDVDEDRAVDPAAGGGERDVQRLCLDSCPREAVEDCAGLRVGLLEAVEEDPDDRLVRDELAATHEPVGLATEWRAVRHGRAEEVTGREDGHAEMPGEDGSLGALPGPRRPEQDDHRHGTRRWSRAAVEAGRTRDVGLGRPAIVRIIG